MKNATQKQICKWVRTIVIPLRHIKFALDTTRGVGNNSRQKRRKKVKLYVVVDGRIAGLLYCSEFYGSTQYSQERERAYQKILADREFGEGKYEFYSEKPNTPWVDEPNMVYPDGWQEMAEMTSTRPRKST